MEFTCKDFKVGKCEGEKLVDGEIMPLVLTPPEPTKNGMNSLLLALENNKEWFDEMITKNSAVLLRGFDVKNAVDFNDIMETCGWPHIPYSGPAPRTHIHKRVWTANEGPLSELIYYHHEMVLVKEFPKKLTLFCEVAPPEGGETPFVPSFRVAERMMEEFPEFVAEVEKKGLKYTLTSPGNKNAATVRGRRWEDVYGTSDRTEAQTRANALGVELEWLPNGGVKTIIGPLPLTKVFEGRKGRKMWFNNLVGMYGIKMTSVLMADGTEIAANIVQRLTRLRRTHFVKINT